jgi:cation transport ATPase
MAPADRNARRHMVARLGLAWLGMMQVMMFAFPGYLRNQPMSVENQLFLDEAVVLLNWLSLVLTVPVILYCAWPVWKGALGRSRSHVITMDVPVALGISAAFIPSVYATWVNHGEVYFESVTMFVAFLLTARYLEFCAQQTMAHGAFHKTIQSLRHVLSAGADRVALWFTVVQLTLAALAGAYWFVFAPEHAVAVTVALLVISCPCALAMSVPTAIAAAHASLYQRQHVSSRHLEQLSKDTTRVAHQNLYGSMMWHLLLTPLAALGYVQPWLAAITMLVSSLAVAVNALRLYRRQSYELAHVWAGGPAGSRLG